MGWRITSPHPGPRHPRIGPPLRRSPVGCRKPECPQVSTVIKTEPARRRHGGGEASNKAPLLPGVMWTASVSPVATCAQLPETIPSLVYAAATTTLSLARPRMCPRPFLVHPTDTPRAWPVWPPTPLLVWRHGPLGVGARTGRVCSGANVSSVLCAAMRKGLLLTSAGSQEAALVMGRADDPGWSLVLTLTSLFTQC